MSKRLRNFLFVIWLVILLGFVVFVNSILQAFNDFSTSETRRDISLKEAQGLVIFPICTTSYLPQEVNQNVEITYFVDDGEPKSTAKIFFRYRSLINNKLILEILERYSSQETIKNDDFEWIQGAAKIHLLDWMTPPIKSLNNLIFSETWLEDELNKIQLEIHEFDSDTFWYSYEITEPEKYRSTMTEWIANHVEYEVKSLLPIEEVQKITQSMFKCASQ